MDKQMRDLDKKINTLNSKITKNKDIIENCQNENKEMTKKLEMLNKLKNKYTELLEELKNI